MAKILLVDDDPLVVESLLSAMESKGHAVVTASNGIKALKKFDQSAFDLVVTDIIMPEMDGIETILEMRRKRSNAKIVAISGGGRIGNVDYLEMAKKLGAIAVIKKPFRFAEFFTVLNDCLCEKPGAHSLPPPRP